MRPELIEATNLLQRNTAEGIEEAIGLLQNTVYSFSMKVCGHPQDAEDTMQEVLYRSVGHLAKIQSPQALAVWLYTVTRNRCWRMRRKPAHAPTHTLSLDELMPDEAELGRLLKDAGESPEANLLHAEQHHLLHQAVLRVPVQLRMVLVLHDMEELTTEQVAQILNLQQGTVRVRLHRARLWVRKEMARTLDAVPGEGDHHSETRVAKRSRKSRIQRPRSVASYSQIFLNTWMVELSRVPVIRCANISMHVQPVLCFFATCVERSIGAARLKFPATQPLHPVCVQSLPRSTCECSGCRTKKLSAVL